MNTISRSLPSTRLAQLASVARSAVNRPFGRAIREHAGISTNHICESLGTVEKLADTFFDAINTSPNDRYIRDILNSCAQAVPEHASAIGALANMPETWNSFSQARGHAGYQALIWAFRALDKKDSHCHISTGLHESEIAEIMLSKHQYKKELMDGLRKAEDEYRESYPKNGDIPSSTVEDIEEALDSGNLVHLTKALNGFVPLNLWSAKDFFVVDLDSLREAVKRTALRMLADGVVSFELRMNPIKPELIDQAVLTGKSTEEKVTEISRQVIQAAIQGLDEAIQQAKEEYGVEAEKDNISLLFSFNRAKVLKSLDGLHISKAAEYLLSNINRLGGLKDRIAGIDISGPEFSVAETDPNHSPECWEKSVTLANNSGLIVSVHIGDLSSMAGSLSDLYSSALKQAGTDLYEMLAEQHLDYVWKYILMGQDGKGPDRIGHAFALAPSFLSSAWHIFYGDGNSLPDFGGFSNVTGNARILMDHIRTAGTIIEHCPSVTASAETPTTPFGDNLMSSYQILPVYSWIKSNIKVRLGTDGIWYTGTRPRSLSEEIVRILLARPEAINIGTALSLIGIDPESRRLLK